MDINRTNQSNGHYHHYNYLSQSGNKSDHQFQYSDLFDDINNEIQANVQSVQNTRFSQNQNSIGRISNEQASIRSPNGTLMKSERFSWDEKGFNGDFGQIEHDRDSLDKIIKQSNYSNRNTQNSRLSHNSYGMQDEGSRIFGDVNNERYSKISDDFHNSINFYPNKGTSLSFRQSNVDYDPRYSIPQQSSYTFYQQQYQQQSPIPQYQVQQYQQQVPQQSPQQQQSQLYSSQYQVSQAQTNQFGDRLSTEKLNQSIDSGRISFPQFNFGGSERNSLQQQPQSRQSQVYQQQQPQIQLSHYEGDQYQPQVEDIIFTQENPNLLKPQIEEGCTCKKSRCLKLYCDCFSQGKECGEGCKCLGCLNIAGCPERDQAIQLLKLKQMANNIMQDRFVSTKGEQISEEIYSDEQQTESIQSNQYFNAASKSQGCNCKKTRCLKKYCECFNLKQQCTSNCRCENCENGDFGIYGQFNPENVIKKQYKKQVLSNEEIMEQINKKIKTLSVEEIQQIEQERKKFHIVGQGIVDVKL